MIESPRKTLAIKLARQAGEYLLQNFQKIKTGTAKADGSLVSAVDKGAEEIIASQILEHFPEDGILAEEGGQTETTSGYQWIIDPLDGTHNFLAGLPLFGTVLALSYKMEVMLGICVFPTLNEFLYAERGAGAQRNGAPMHVSQAAEMRSGMFLSYGRIQQTKETVFRDIERLSEKGCRIRILGSSPFSMTRVACGEALIATNRKGFAWDIAAPALMVEEAGGKVTDLSGNKWHFNSEVLVATNGIVHEEVINSLNS